MVRRLFALMRLRNTHPAFAVEGECLPKMLDKTTLQIIRRMGENQLMLTADLATHAFQVTEGDTVLFSGER